MLQENEEGILIFRFAVKAHFVILWFWLTLWAWQGLKPAKFKSKICHFPNSLLFVAHTRSVVVQGHGSCQSPEADFQLMPWLRCMSSLQLQPSYISSKLMDVILTHSPFVREEIAGVSHRKLPTSSQFLPKYFPSSALGFND